VYPYFYIFTPYSYQVYKGEWCSFLTQMGYLSLNIFCFIIELIVCFWNASVAGYVKL